MKMLHSGTAAKKICPDEYENGQQKLLACSRENVYIAINRMKMTEGTTTTTKIVQRQTTNSSTSSVTNRQTAKH